MTEEIWKDIEGYENLYQVSNLGRVKSISRLYVQKGNKKIRMEGRILESVKKRYPQCNLSVNGHREMKQIHRLVAMAFIPNPENKPYVNHINAIKNDNRVVNLEWCTPKENDHHAMKMGLKAKGENNGYSKLKQKDVNEIRAKYKPRKYTNKMLAKEYGISYHEIQLITSNKRWV